MIARVQTGERSSKVSKHYGAADITGQVAIGENMRRDTRLPDLAVRQIWLVQTSRSRSSLMPPRLDCHATSQRKKARSI